MEMGDFHFTNLHRNLAQLEKSFPGNYAKKVHVSNPNTLFQPKAFNKHMGATFCLLQPNNCSRAHKKIKELRFIFSRLILFSFSFESFQFGHINGFKDVICSYCQMLYFSI